jgi:hypothetical protein
MDESANVVLGFITAALLTPWDESDGVHPAAANNLSLMHSRAFSPTSNTSCFVPFGSQP